MPKVHPAWRGGQVRVRRTTLITVFCCALLAGLMAAKSHAWLMAVLALGGVTVLLGAVRFRRTILWLTIVGVIGVSIGLWRGAQFTKLMQPYQALYGQKIRLTAVAKEDAVYGTNGQLSLDITQLRVESPIESSLPGRIKLSGFGELMVYKGDTLAVEGKLRSTLGGRQGQMSFATIKVVQHSPSSIDIARREFATGMLNALPEPAASFGLGLLIGQRSTLPKNVSDQLAIVGLTHLVAVSGYNLTIIVQAVRRATGKRSKYQSLAASLLLVGAFLLVTGMSASIVRAAIVSVLTLLAWYYGRSIRPLLLISLTAALTACAYPIYLWSDIGWYLSFLAFFGVLVLAPLVSRRLYGERELKFLHATVLETVCAQIMTLPLILYTFQQLSIVSILSNVLVVPLVPYAMLAALIAGSMGAIIPELAGWFSWPARIILTYMLDVAAALSRVPHAVARVGLSASGFIAMYGIIIGWAVLLTRPHHKQKLAKHATITDRV